MSYRDDLDALSARHAALESEVAQKGRELEQATRLLEDARARARLPVLDNIRVASPCTADWKQMTGDDRVRYCGDCRKNVYNLSDLTRDEATALIVGLEGELCVRYFKRADGTILLADDCAVGRRRRRRRRVVVAGAAAALAGAGALGWQLSQESYTMGAMEAEPRQYQTLGKYEGVAPSPEPAVEAPAPLPQEDVLGRMRVEEPADRAEQPRRRPKFE